MLINIELVGQFIDLICQIVCLLFKSDFPVSGRIISCFVALIHLTLIDNFLLTFLQFLWLNLLFFFLRCRSHSSGLKLKFAISYFSSLFVRSSSGDLGIAKHKSNFDSFIFYTLERATNIDRKLAQFLNRLIINKINSFHVRGIKYNPHHGLPSSDRAISLHVHLINTNCLSLCHKCIKNIFAEVFSFNNYFLFISMSNRVISCKSINTISFLWNAWGNGTRVQTIHASTTNNRNLRSFRYKYSQVFSFELLFNHGFEIWGFREASDHKDKVYWAAGLGSIS